MNSKFIDIKNEIYSYFQNKFENMTNNSFILSNVDGIILFFIGLTLISSTVLASEKIGAFAIIVVLLTVIKLFTKKGAKVAITGFDGALIVYFAICFISTINSTLLPQSIHGFLKTVIYIFYYFCAVNYFQTNQNKIRYVFMLVGVLCSIEAFIAICQNFAGVEQISTWQDTSRINPEDVLSRVYGTLKPLNPNLYGGYLVCGLPIVIGFIFHFLNKKCYKSALLPFCGMLVTIFAILQTGCRGAYLSMLLVFGCIFLFSAKFLE